MNNEIYTSYWYWFIGWCICWIFGVYLKFLCTVSQLYCLKVYFIHPNISSTLNYPNIYSFKYRWLSQKWSMTHLMPRLVCWNSRCVGWLGIYRFSCHWRVYFNILECIFIVLFSFEVQSICCSVSSFVYGVYLYCVQYSETDHLFYTIYYTVY
jgi:hypothetical protein